MSSIAKDYLYFYGNKYEIEFLLSEVLEYPSSGGIGLQLLPQSLTVTNTLSFLEKIKNIGLGNNYSWSIIFNNKNEYDGYLLLGDYFHNINYKDIFLKNENYSSDSLYSVLQIVMRI